MLQRFMLPRFDAFNIFRYSKWLQAWIKWLRSEREEILAEQQQEVPYRKGSLAVEQIEEGG